MRVVTQLGVSSAEAALVTEAFPDVELIEWRPDGPPPGLRAEVFLGGHGRWDDVLRWIDATGVHWVQLTGTGVDQVPAELYRPGRVVTCARGASAVPISEWVLAALLSYAKRMPDVFLDAPPRHWNLPSPRLDGFAGTTLAVYGLGGIGSAVAARALPFGVRVRAMRRTDAPSPVPGVELVRSIDELVAGAHHLVLAAPATRRTHHAVDERVLAQVGPGLHLVNVARGSLVDQDALRRALDDGRVAMATLDTVDPEPLPAGHWMYDHPRVRLSAHVSWYTPALLRAAVEIFVDNLRRYRAGEPLLHVVDPDEGY